MRVINDKKILHWGTNKYKAIATLAVRKDIPWVTAKVEGIATLSIRNIIPWMTDEDKGDCNENCEGDG